MVQCNVASDEGGVCLHPNTNADLHCTNNVPHAYHLDCILQHIATWPQQFKNDLFAGKLNCTVCTDRIRAPAVPS